MTKFVRFSELPEYGVRYSRTHLTNLIKAGKFPAPIKMRRPQRRHLLGRGRLARL
jgi:hypothetical protein